MVERQYWRCVEVAEEETGGAVVFLSSIPVRALSSGISHLPLFLVSWFPSSLYPVEEGYEDGYGNC